MGFTTHHREAERISRTSYIQKALAADLMACKEFICTVIRVASEEKCSAWQFTSKVITYDGKPLGDLISLRKGSQGKIVVTYF